MQTDTSSSPSRAVVTPLPQRVVRCACEQCGAHTNAVWSFRVGGSCPTCGSFRLAPIEGAELMLGTRLVA
jgi:Zn finger protein HypA/HybF involved in hydrogenase expression